jgi:hypothetical protein
MLDINSGVEIVRDLIILLFGGGIVITIIQIIAWRSYARSGVKIYSIAFWPPETTKKSIKFETLDEISYEKDSKMAPYIKITSGPLKGKNIKITSGTFRGSIRISLVSLYFSIMNPGLFFTEVVKEIALKVRVHDKNQYKLGPIYFGRTDGIPDEKIPAELHFKEITHPISIKPKSENDYQLVFISSQLSPIDNTVDCSGCQIFADLTPGEYDCSLLLKYERKYPHLLDAIKIGEKSRCIDFRFWIRDVTVEHAWKRGESAIIPRANMNVGKVHKKCTNF